jgi:hypothetical protein
LDFTRGPFAILQPLADQPLHEFGWIKPWALRLLELDRPVLGRRRRPVGDRFDQ